MGGACCLPAGVEEIKYDELSVGMKDGTIILVDVRSPSELKDNGSIPGAINIPSPEIREAFALGDEEFQAKYGFEKTFPNLVFSCRSGLRAGMAISHLKGTIPSQNMKLYNGSFSDWKKKGGPINK